LVSYSLCFCRILPKAPISPGFTTLAEEGYDGVAVYNNGLETAGSLQLSASNPHVFTFIANLDMSLTRIFNEPFFSLTDFDRLFDDAFARRTDNNQVAQQRGSRTVVPRMDIHEDQKANVVTATFELPGLKKDDVQIDIQNNVLTVSGESKISSDRDEDGYAIRERRYGKFSRAIPLPQGVKADDIKANMENGVLTVVYPRTTPEQQAKRIAVA